MDEDTPGWTLAELSRRAALALTSGGAPGVRPGAAGPPDATPGRGRELPDPRAIRWYASIGLVDRPVGGRGRGARYGLRHLRQLVAVKRLQAQGWSLADIQGRLAAADDETLRLLADLPESASGPHPAPDAVVRSDGRSDGRSDARASGRFWLAAPEALARPGPGGPQGPLRPSVAPPAPLGVVHLAGGVVLVLPRQPADGELALITEAASPLVAALAGLGLAALVPPSTAEPQSGAS